MSEDKNKKVNPDPQGEESENDVEGNGDEDFCSTKQSKCSNDCFGSPMLSTLN